jgi:hypothetical protein
MFTNVLLINLDRRNDRLKESQTELLKHGIKFERVSAIDGDALGIDSELACLMSHIKAIKLAKERKWNNVLILEDDVKLHDNFNYLFNKYITQLNPLWDGLLFGANHKEKPRQSKRNISRLIRSYALHAYAINRPAYDTIIEYIDGKDKPVDYLMADLHDRMRFYCFNPHLAWQRPSYSDIQKTNVDYTFLKWH